MLPINQIKDFDNFFYYGLQDVEAETEHDLILGLLQPKRSFFYNRQDGAGIQDYENHPNGLMIEIGMRYDIANWIARRNEVVGNGEGGTKERRVATSQNAIKIEREVQTLGVVSRRTLGSINVSVLYIPLRDVEQPRVVTIPFGGGGVNE